jgi:hypothetical protein
MGKLKPGGTLKKTGVVVKTMKRRTPIDPFEIK